MGCEWALRGVDDDDRSLLRVWFLTDQVVVCS